jgi:cell wall-associated NlpC family hydrolase
MFALLAALAAALALAVGPASADPSVSSKRAQAEAILGQVEQLNSELEKTVEAYNYANVQLERLDADLASNARHLDAARKSLGRAQQTIAQRLRDLYVHGGGDSTLEVLLGSRSLEDIVTRLDAIQRVSKQDSRVLSDVRRYKREVLTRRANLRDARQQQTQIVAQRAADRQTIEGKIAEQSRLYESVKDEIAQLKAEERARQTRLAAAARARLQAQQAAEQQSHTEIAQAVAAAAADEVTYNGDLPEAQYGGVVSIAMQYLGIPYVWGGSSPSTGFDCSGFVMYVFAQVGVSLPHHAASQYSYGVPVSREQLAPGDLVFFDYLGHVGIYIGSGQFVHAPHSGDVVKISSIYEDWYASTWVGARRL